jgi:diguanylate cyclase (GGDEF)-like protein
MTGCRQALAQAQRGRHRVAVMFLDLDRFKTVNDTLGHAIGDELLKHVAERLKGVVRAVDTVSRLGGDEFVIVLHEMSSPDDVVQVAEKILGALAPAVDIDGHALRATSSIGISMFPDDGDEAIALMKCADAAMYHAKAAGAQQLPVLCATR